MNRQEIEQKAKAVILDVLKLEQPDRLTDHTNLPDDLDADSLDYVDIIIGLESEFDVHINENEVYDLRTPKEIYDYLEKHLK